MVWRFVLYVYTTNQYWMMWTFGNAGLYISELSTPTSKAGPICVGNEQDSARQQVWFYLESSSFTWLCASSPSSKKGRPCWCNLILLKIILIRSWTIHLSCFRFILFTETFTEAFRFWTVMVEWILECQNFPYKHCTWRGRSRISAHQFWVGDWFSVEGGQGFLLWIRTMLFILLSWGPSNLWPFAWRNVVIFARKRKPW